MSDREQELGERESAIRDAEQKLKYLKMNPDIAMAGALIDSLVHYQIKPEDIHSTIEELNALQRDAAKVEAERCLDEAKMGKSQKEKIKKVRTLMERWKLMAEDIGATEALLNALEGIDMN